MTRPIKQAAVLAAGLLALTGCGSGLNALTYEPRAAADSSDAASGPLTVRNVFVVAPEEAGYQPGEDAEVVLSAATRASEEDRLVSATSEAATSVEVPDDLVVPVNGLMLAKRITLVGLKERLRSSEYVPLLLTFASGATIPVNVPVEVTDAEPEPNPDFEIPETDSVGKPLKEGAGIHGGGGEDEEAHSDGEAHSEEG